MKEFRFESGLVVTVDEKIITINRTATPMKSIFKGQAVGWTIIKISSITGLICNAGSLVICASGFASPYSFKVSEAYDRQQLPNCIEGKIEEVKELCRYIRDLM